MNQYARIGAAVSLNGFATWDDYTGAVTITASGNNIINVGGTAYAYTVTIKSAFSGNAGIPFSPTSGTYTASSCSGTVGGYICALMGSGTTAAFDSVGGSLTLASGTLTSHQVVGTGLQAATTDTTYTLVAPVPVPIPSGAWLFGSGLVGLAGVARRCSL